LTGGLQMVMTATPSAPTSSSVLPFAAIDAAISAPVVPRFLAAVAFLQLRLAWSWELVAGIYLPIMARTASGCL